MRRQVADSRHSKGRYPNTSDAIYGTPCDGCRYCEVLVRRRYKRDEERYWCNKRHCYEKSPWTVACDQCEKEDD